MCDRSCCAGPGRRSQLTLSSNPSPATNTMPLVISHTSEPHTHAIHTITYTQVFAGTSMVAPALKAEAYVEISSLPPDAFAGVVLDPDQTLELFGACVVR